MSYNLLIAVSVYLIFVSCWSDVINLTLSISTNDTLRVIEDEYIGFNLDYWKNNTDDFDDNSIPFINFSNKDLIILTSALQPAIIRIGGSGEDSTIYNISGECNEPQKWNGSTPNYYCSEVKPPNYFCMNKTRWKQIFDFLDATNMKLVYGLNACYGRYGKDQLMDISNIDSFLYYTASSTSLNVSRMYGFEFGNGLSDQINSQIYSYDFIRMNTLIQRYFVNYTTNIPISIGTDSGYAATDFVENVLLNMPNATMNALDYHQYIECPQGDNSVFNKDCLSKITETPPIYENIVINKTHQMNTTIWIGESALDHSGGIKGQTNVFLSSFYYMYQLSELAKYEYMQTVLRQTLCGGNYELINGTNNNFTPNPDYWVLYLWRQFIGKKVLQSTLTTNNNVSGYAYSGKNTNEVVVVLINFSYYDTANVTLDLKEGVESAGNYKYSEYHMNGPLNSSVAYINKQPLIYKDGQFPSLQPTVGDGNVILSPSTIVWIVCVPSSLTIKHNAP